MSLPAFVRVSRVWLPLLLSCFLQTVAYGNVALFTSGGIVPLDGHGTLSIHVSSLESVQSLSYGVCLSHDDLVSIESLDDVSIGADLALSNAGAGPDFFDVSLFGSEHSTSWVVSFSSSDRLPASASAEVSRVRFRGDRLGTAEVAFCDVLGNPPVLVAAQLASGPAIPAVSTATLSVVEEMVLRAPDGVILQGAARTFTLTLGSRRAVSGFQFGLCASEAGVVEWQEPNAIVPGPALMLLNGGQGPDFFQGNRFPGGECNVGCLVSIGPPFEVLMPADSLEAVEMSFQGTAPGQTELSFCTLGIPPIQTLFVVDEMGFSPIERNGVIEVLPSEGGGGTAGTGDVNGDEMIDVSDVVYLVNFLFLDGSPPVEAPCR